MYNNMKILSWNILANEFIKQDYYPMIPRHILFNRANRQDQIIRHLKSIEADIMFLQEVMQSEYNLLTYEFSNSYHIIRGKYIRWQNKRSYSGNVILLRKTLFFIQDIQYDLSFGLAVQCFFKKTKKDKPNPLLIINVHLDDISQSTRLKQIKALEPMILNHSNIILGGDFNENYTKYQTKHHTKLYDTLFKYQFKGYNHEPTYYIDMKTCIDNILFKGFESYSKKTIHLNMDILANIDTVANADTPAKFDTLANLDTPANQYAYYGSDHLPVIVEVK